MIFALLKYDFLVLYPVNPKTVAKYREAFSPSGAKDDPTDADYQLEILTYHRDRLKAWRPDDEKTRTLQYMVEHRRRLDELREAFIIISASSARRCAGVNFRALSFGDIDDLFRQTAIIEIATRL